MGIMWRRRAGISGSRRCCGAFFRVAKPIAWIRGRFAPSRTASFGLLYQFGLPADGSRTIPQSGPKSSESVMSALHCRVIQTPMSRSQDCPAAAARLVMFEPFQPACMLPDPCENPYEQPGGERKSIRFIRMRCHLPRRCQIGTRNTHNPIRQSPRQCRVTALDAGFENEVGFRMLPASCRVIYSLLVATSWPVV